MILRWKIGFEIELVAPPGRSRRDLAERVAQHRAESVRTFFHPQSEPSHVAGQPIFQNLTAGFEVVNADGSRFAAFVDDLTLQSGLHRSAAPKPGWFRIVADDVRLLRLVMRHCDPDADREAVLDPFAALFGTEAQHHESGMIRVADNRGASVAICAPLPGERERPCEIVTAPIEQEHHAVLAELLGHARALGFTIPREAATHLHFDGARFCSAPLFARVVAVLDAHREALRAMVRVNPNCIRLGGWPPELIALTRSKAFAAMDWAEAKQALSEVDLVKYCDFNLVNLLSGDPDKHTIEIRILPSSLDPAPILAAACLFEALFDYCGRSFKEDRVPPLASLLRRLKLPRETMRQFADPSSFISPMRPSESLIPVR